jgi:hypothetical protein
MVFLGSLAASRTLDRNGSAIGLGWRRRAVVVAAAVLVAVSCVVSPAHAAISAAEQLANTYAPIVMMRSQENGTCDSSEEQFWPPTSVEVTLGNPRVRLLRHTRRGNQVIMRAPTAADIAGLGPSYYLDLPGNPLNPGCTYARDFAAIRRAGHAPAITYAHIARQPGHPGFALQFWFYYYFNVFNDLHESDWEGMQLAFSAATPAQAVGTEPYGIVLFQHAGGEHARWDASKVQHRGTHPVVYSAAGSHATFYGSALYLGNGDHGSGVGCDNTTAPLMTITPRPVLLPDVPSGRGPFAWLTYTGRWGQLEAGFNNGPAGPNTKTEWREPFTWMNGTRTQSPTVPAVALVGPSVSSAFCGVVSTVSEFLNLQARTTPGAIGVGVIVALLILVPVTLMTWRPVNLQPLRQPRALGQLLLGAGRLYGQNFAPLLMIALISLLLVGALEGIESLLMKAFGSHGSGVSVAGASISISTGAGLGRTLAAPVGSAAVTAFVRNRERAPSGGFAAAWRATLSRLWRLIAVQLLATALVVLLMLTIIGIPFAIRKWVDWQFGQQEILFEDRSIREALRGSTRMVRGHWWHTSAATVTFWLLSEIPGPVLGFALLFTTVPVTSVDLFGSVVSALLIPYVCVGRTLLYLDLAARRAGEPASVPASLAPAPAG